MYKLTCVLQYAYSNLAARVNIKLSRSVQRQNTVHRHTVVPGKRSVLCTIHRTRIQSRRLRRRWIPTLGLRAIWTLCIPPANVERSPPGWTADRCPTTLSASSPVTRTRLHFSWSSGWVCAHRTCYRTPRSTFTRALSRIPNTTRKTNWANKIPMFVLIGVIYSVIPFDTNEYPYSFGSKVLWYFAAKLWNPVRVVWLTAEGDWQPDLHRLV